LKTNPKDSEIRNSKSEMGGPMLFARNALAPGPRLRIPENVKFCDRPEALAIYLGEFMIK
jgi:hypothetical protein